MRMKRNGKIMIRHFFIAFLAVSVWSSKAEAALVGCNVSFSSPIPRNATFDWLDTFIEVNCASDVPGGFVSYYWPERTYVGNSIRWIDGQPNFNPRKPKTITIYATERIDLEGCKQKDPTRCPVSGDKATFGPFLYNIVNACPRLNRFEFGKFDSRKRSPQMMAICSNTPTANGKGRAVNCQSDDIDCVARPVNVATGAMWHIQEDFRVNGRTPDTALHFTRHYTSTPAVAVGSLGPNWRHNYETQLIRSPNPQNPAQVDLVWVDEKGGPYLFKNVTEGNYIHPEGYFATITEYADRIELKKKDNVVLTFDKVNFFGKLLKITERHGESVVLSYDSTGQLQTVASPFAGSITFSYNSEGRITQIHRDRDNLSYTYDYNSNGQLISVTDFQGRVKTFGYETNRAGTFAQGKLNLISDELARPIEFNYDDDGKVKQVKEPLGQKWNLDYTGGASVGVVMPNGQKRAYEFNSDLLKTKYSDSSGKRDLTEISVGLPSVIKNEHGGSTKFVRDDNGNILQKISPLPATRTSEFHPDFNLPTRVRVGNLIPTDLERDINTGDVKRVKRTGSRSEMNLIYTRDQFGNILSVNNGRTIYSHQRDANGFLTYRFDLYNPESISYDSRGRVASRHFQSGRTLSYTYNNDDQVLTETDSHGPDTENVYDLVGNLLEVRKTDGVTVQKTKYEYDSLNRVISTTDALNRKTTFEFDQAKVREKPSKIIDPAGRETLFEYDDADRIISKTDAVGATTRYTYDARGNLTRVVDALGNETLFQYDLNDRKILEIRPSIVGNQKYGSRTYFFYDQSEQLVRIFKEGIGRAQNRELLFKYDEFGRLIRRIVQKVGATTVVEDDSTFSYEPQLDFEIMKSAVNGVAALQFQSDLAPPFSTTSFSVAAAVPGNPLGLLEGTYIIERDVTGEISSVSKNGYMFQKTFDQAGRIISGTMGPGSSSFTYDGFGRRETIVHSGGESGSFQRDLLDRLTQVTWAGPTPISVALGYDLAGNVTSLEREGSSASTIAYDAVDQLLSSVGGSTEARAFSYDGVGNRLTDSLNGAGNFISNFLTSNGVASYVADPNGFGDTIQETKGGVTKNFFYRADGRISGFQSGNLQVEYYYDALDRLAAKAINDNGNSYTQSFAYVGRDKDLFQAKAGDGSITTYLNGNGPDDHIAQLKDGVYKGYVTDQIGSVLNSEIGGPTHRYELFGGSNGAAPLSVVSDPVSYGYAGGMHNRESKTTKFDWRDLHHETGRWGSMDPIGFEGSDLNYYRYVLNRPIGLVDPDGLFPIGPVIGWGLVAIWGINFFEWFVKNLNQEPIPKGFNPPPNVCTVDSSKNPRQDTIGPAPPRRGGIVWDPYWGPLDDDSPVPRSSRPETMPPFNRLGPPMRRR